MNSNEGTSYTSYADGVAGSNVSGSSAYGSIMPGSSVTRSGVTVNRQFKDTLFRMLFGDPEKKKNTLSLYNALNGTAYDNADELTITTIDDVIYMGYKNDVSCLLDHYLFLGEHQSTINPNMPVRGLIYFGRLYDQYISTRNVNIYSSELKKLPTPQYFVLYNGNTELPDKSFLRLSDSFVRPVEEGAFEWTATVVNINDGHNREIMEACSTLQQYSKFVAKYKEHRSKGEDIRTAVISTVDECIEEGILRDFLVKHKAEVTGMCLTEYNEQETLAAIRNEERESAFSEGIAIGEARGRETSEALMAKLINSLLVSGRSADALRVTTDPEYRKQMLAALSRS